MRLCVSRTALLGILCLLLIAHTPPTFADNGFLKRVTIITGEWAPYTSEADSHRGYLSELVTEALGGMGLKPEYVFLPFAYGYERAKSGEAFATFPYFHSDKREAEFFFSRALDRIDYVIFVRTDKADKFAEVKASADLSAFKTVRVDGYGYGEFEKHIRPADSQAQSEIQAFRHLLEGKIDYLAASREVGRRLIERYFFRDQHQFQILTPPGATEPIGWSMDIHLLFPKSQPDAEANRDAFDKKLGAVLASGFRQVLQRRNNDEIRSRRIVRLTDPGSFALVTAKDSPDAKESFIIPRGTRALVIDWSKNFTEKMVTTVFEQMQRYSRVQLINGPLKGRLVYVRNMFIELPKD